MKSSSSPRCPRAWCCPRSRSRCRTAVQNSTSRCKSSCSRSCRTMPPELHASASSALGRSCKTAPRSSSRWIKTLAQCNGIACTHPPVCRSSTCSRRRSSLAAWCWTYWNRSCSTAKARRPACAPIWTPTKTNSRPTTLQNAAQSVPVQASKILSRERMAAKVSERLALATLARWESSNHRQIHGAIVVTDPDCSLYYFHRLDEATKHCVVVSPLLSLSLFSSFCFLMRLIFFVVQLRRNRDGSSRSSAPSAFCCLRSRPSA